ncbi:MULTISPECIES: hypothetical protein [Bacteria]|uniref:hypothetical protein n=1 Tax=Bacteria TaxID=2 RepID=UPI001A9D62E6|nr:MULTISPECIES: hypothetical protein [Bacteria]
MPKAIERSEALHPTHAGRLRKSGRQRLDWRKRMSDNVAYALLVYTGLQIFVTVHALKSGADSSSMMPYLALVVLVAAIIPACRAFEGRWLGISDEAAADPGYRGAYRRDQALLWIVAIGLPFALTALFKTLSSVF